MKLEQSVIRSSCHVLIPEELEAEVAIPLHPTEHHELGAEGGLVNCKVVWSVPIDWITGLEWGIKPHILGVDMSRQMKRCFVACHNLQKLIISVLNQPQKASRLGRSPGLSSCRLTGLKG